MVAPLTIGWEGTACAIKICVGPSGRGEIRAVDRSMEVGSSVMTLLVSVDSVEIDRAGDPSARRTMYIAVFGAL